MTDIKVPHEYLDTLRHIRGYSIMGQGERAEVLDALIAAAEADAPLVDDSMTDKIVTHEDLDAIAVIERECSALTCEGRAIDLLRRLRAAAEADQPPLPEGWVLLRLADGAHRVLWHHDGRLSVVKPHPGLRGDFFGEAASIRDRLTPLRHTVTEADVEKVARAARAAYYGADEWDEADRDARDVWMKTVRAALDTLDIEVGG